MKDLDGLKKILIEPITINNINRINDCFIRYLFSDPGSENIVLNFINSVMKDSNFDTFVSVEILNPFNLSKYLHNKESIMDVRCRTNKGKVVIIEIQLQGNDEFIYRALFYWAGSYSVMLKKGDNYNKLMPVISINLLNFKLIKNIEDIHTCYVLKDMKHNNILTDHCQLHFIELPKFESCSDMEKDFLSWLKFFKGENMESLLKENTIFESVKSKAESFISDEPLLDAYKNKETEDYFNQRMLEYEINQAENRGLEKGIAEGREKGIAEGREKGIAEGLEKGKKEEKIIIARSMKAENIDVNVISRVTDLSIEDILKL